MSRWKDCCSNSVFGKLAPGKEQPLEQGRQFLPARDGQAGGGETPLKVNICNSWVPTTRIRDGTKVHKMKTVTSKIT